MAVAEYRGDKTYQVSAALSQYRRVRLSSGKLAYAGTTDNDCLGTLNAASLAADEYRSVRSPVSEGTHIMIASEAITAGNVAYAGASGKVAATGTLPVGIAITAATADGDWIEVSPLMALTTIARGAITQDDLQSYQIPLTDFVTWDAVQTKLPGTPANDDLGIITGTFLTDVPQLEGTDAGGTTETEKGGVYFAMPPEYVDGQTATLRIRAKMLTTVSDGTATVDAQVVRVAAPTVDICATAAQSINSLTAADKDFTLTPTNLVKGDMLFIVLTTAVTDSGNAAGGITAVILEVELLLDIKG